MVTINGRLVVGANGKFPSLPSLVGVVIAAVSELEVELELEEAGVLVPVKRVRLAGVVGKAPRIETVPARSVGAVAPALDVMLNPNTAQMLEKASNVTGNQ